MALPRLATVVEEDEYPTTPFPCGAEVHGERRGHCVGCYGGFTGCCRTFYGIEAWNKHRTGPMDNRRCRSDAELLDKGLIHDAGIWRMAGDTIDDNPAAPDGDEQ